MAPRAASECIRPPNSFALNFQHPLHHHWSHSARAFFRVASLQKDRIPPMKNFLILGAGAQGAPCAAVLAHQSSVDRVLLGSTRLSSAASVRDRIGSPKVVAAEIDACKPGALVKAVRDSLGTVDAVIDMTPSFCSADVMRAALALDAHYVNTAACPEHLALLIQRQPLDLHDDFVNAGRTALLGC